MATKHTVTDEQIRELAREAGAAGDVKMRAICLRALSGSKRARAQCVTVIREARANQES